MSDIEQEKEYLRSKIETDDYELKYAIALAVWGVFLFLVTTILERTQ